MNCSDATGWAQQPLCALPRSRAVPKRTTKNEGGGPVDLSQERDSREIVQPSTRQSLGQQTPRRWGGFYRCGTINRLLTAADLLEVGWHVLFFCRCLHRHLESSEPCPPRLVDKLRAGEPRLVRHTHVEQEKATVTQRPAAIAEVCVLMVLISC